MKVSVIGGTGPQGLGIAERLAIAGVDVIVGSRKEEKALDVVAKAKEELASSLSRRKNICRLPGTSEAQQY